MKKYWQIFVMAWGNLLEYRVNFLWWVLGSIITTLALMAFWTAILSSGLGVEKYSVYSLSIYYLIIGFTNSFISYSGNEAANEIWNGNLSADIVRPYNFFIRYFLTSLPGRLVTLVLIILVLIGINFHIGLVNFFLWILCLFAGLFLYFFSYLMINGLAFWFRRVHGFAALFYNVGGLLSGFLIPIDLLPPSWANLAKYLPFQYLAYVPAKVLLGQYTYWQIVQHIVLAIIWALIFAIIARIIWKKGLKNYDSIGR
ncbi:MAG: ABC-2 family transporter protein [bacterium]|nr:ABC-2 family transporter protein [bacterium]